MKVLSVKHYVCTAHTMYLVLKWEAHGILSKRHPRSGKQVYAYLIADTFPHLMSFLIPYML